MIRPSKCHRAAPCGAAGLLLALALFAYAGAWHSPAGNEIERAVAPSFPMEQVKNEPTETGGRLLIDRSLFASKPTDPCSTRHFFPASETTPRRIVVIGDVHGAMRGLRGALWAAALLDAHDNWIGGSTILVQVGDVLDKGRNELDAILLLERLRTQAAKAGGRVCTILGNHDAFNIAGLYEFSPNISGLLPNRFAFGEKLNVLQPRVKKYPEYMRSRAAAFLSGGPAARLFALTRPAAVTVNGTLFVHAFLDKALARFGLDAINDLVRNWMAYGQPSALPDAMWTLLQARTLGLPLTIDVKDPRCVAVREALGLLNMTRLVIGHTPQWSGIGGVCGGMVWRVDAGLSVMGTLQRDMQVLEIVGDQLAVLSLSPPFEIDSVITREPVT